MSRRRSTLGWNSLLCIVWVVATSGVVWAQETKDEETTAEEPEGKTTAAPPTEAEAPKTDADGGVGTPPSETPPAEAPARPAPAPGPAGKTAPAAKDGSAAKAKDGGAPKAKDGGAAPQGPPAKNGAAPPAGQVRPSGDRRAPGSEGATKAPGDEGAPPGPGTEGGAGAGQGAETKTLRILPKSPSFKAERVDISHGEIEVLEFLRFIADYTGLPVIFDSSNPQAGQQKILIVADMVNVTADVVIALLQANRFVVTRQVLPSGEEVLNVISQQTAVPQTTDPVENKVLRVEGADVRQIEGSFEAVAQGIRPDEIATMVFTLKYTQPTDAIQSLQSLVGGGKGQQGRSPTFSLVDVKNSMMVIITAKFGLLNYLAKLLSIIDVPIKEPERIIQIIDVENADAEELTQLIQTFLQGRGTQGSRLGARIGAPTQPGQPPQPGAIGRASTQDLQTNLIADWRTQKIIIETYSERDLEDIHMLVRELDARFDIRRLKTRIYQVRYLKADEVASDLQILLGASGGGFSGRAGLGTRGVGPGAGATGAATRGRTGATGGVPRVQRRGGAGTVGGPTPAVPGAQGAGGQNAPMPALIVPHTQTNSLIIQAEPEEYAEILNILEQIDIKRRQVFLEAALVQVNSTSELLYIIELMAGEPNDTATRALFESSFGLSGIDFEQWTRTIPDLAAPASVPAGGILAIMHRGKFPALVRFFKGNTDSEVLATPFILADDNQPNTINITETRFVQNTNTVNTSTTTSQEGEDAGITLDITPTISSQSAVYLEMSLTVSQFEGSGGTNLLPPKTSNEIQSAVTVPDGQIFVIGGLTREGRSKSVSKVPIVGDIPLIGKLFRSESSTKSAANLYIFLRAHVLTHPEFADGANLTQQALGQVHEFAPGLEPTRFKRPIVQFPPARPDDPTRPIRFYPGRKQYAEGHEAPRGAFEPEHPSKPDVQKAYQHDPERPDSGAEGTPPVPRESQQGPTVAPPPEGTSAEPPRTKPGEPAGGLEVPPRVELPPPPNPEEARNPPALEGTGMEIDPDGDSWLVPLRPKK